MPERIPVLVPAALLPLARERQRGDVALYAYELLPNSVTSRLLWRTGLRDASRHFASRWRFPPATPLESIRSIWFAPEAQFGAQEAEELLRCLPALRSVYWQRTGLDTLPVEQFTSRGIRIVTSHGLTTRWVAEAIVACILADAKLLMRSMKGRMPPLSHYTRAVESLHVAILGTGSIGRDAARLCRELGMRVTGLARTVNGNSTTSPVFTEIRRSGDDLLRTAAEADYLVLALPLSAHTEGLIGQNVIDALGPKGVLVNLARPGLVNQRAMLRALNRGTLGAAYVSRLDGSYLEVALKTRWTRNLVLTHNREAHVREKPVHALEQFLAVVDAASPQIGRDS